MTKEQASPIVGSRERELVAVPTSSCFTLADRKHGIWGITYEGVPWPVNLRLTLEQAGPIQAVVERAFL